MNTMTANNGKIVIVKDSETGLLGAVVCPMEEFCSVVFGDGTWIHFAKSENSPVAVSLKTKRKMDALVKIGEADFAPPPYERKIPADIQQKYVEAALKSISLFKEGGNQ
jgi:hypothetical protein